MAILQLRNNVHKEFINEIPTWKSQYLQPESTYERGEIDKKSNYAEAKERILLAQFELAQLLQLTTLSDQPGGRPGTTAEATRVASIYFKNISIIE